MLVGGFTVCFPRGWVAQERTTDMVLGIMNNEIDQRIIVKYTVLNDPLPYMQRVLKTEINATELGNAEMIIFILHDPWRAALHAVL